MNVSIVSWFGQARRQAGKGSVSPAKTLHYVRGQPGYQGSCRGAGGDESDNVTGFRYCDRGTGCAWRQSAIEDDKTRTGDGLHGTGGFLQDMHARGPISTDRDFCAEGRRVLSQRHFAAGLRGLAQGCYIPLGQGPVSRGGCPGMVLQGALFIPQQDVDSVTVNIGQAMGGRDQGAVLDGKACAMRSRFETGMVQPSDRRVGGNNLRAPGS